MLPIHLRHQKLQQTILQYRLDVRQRPHLDLLFAYMLIEHKLYRCDKSDVGNDILPIRN